MSATIDKLIKLLGQTDGRDKIYKFLAGLFKILATIAARNSDPMAKAYVALGNSITSARSLMRMGRFIADVPKLQGVVSTVQCNGLANTELKKLIEFVRTLCNSLYILGDNISFIAKHKLIGVNAKLVTGYAKIAQFWGFLLASILDLIALRKAVEKSATDTLGSKKDAKAAVIGFTKDMSDVLVTMPAAGYLTNVWRPSGITSGALTAVSGGIATYLNWNKIK